MIRNITIGSDPEYLVFNPKTQLCYPGLEFTSGTKEDPEFIAEGFYIQKDNALLEGNIPICTSKPEFLYNLDFLLGYMNFLVSPKGLEIIHEDSGVFHKKHLKSPEVNIFGCDPYNNVWTKDVRRAPSLSDFTHRTCGFHIHIGYELTNSSFTREQFNQFIVKAFDLKVILPSYLIHFDPKRAAAYGGLGQYRDKPYGVECRSLGGYFTHPERVGWVWDRTMESIEICTNERNLKVLDNLELLTDLEPASIMKYISEFDRALTPVTA